jgi:hypothetical protein
MGSLRIKDTGFSAVYEPEGGKEPLARYDLYLLLAADLISWLKLALFPRITRTSISDMGS